jgi:hypothetical protein
MPRGVFYSLLLWLLPSKFPILIRQSIAKILHVTQSVTQGSRIGTERAAKWGGECSTVEGQYTQLDRVQETFRIGNVGADLCKKSDRIHSG